MEFHHPDRLDTKLVTNNTANTSFEQATLPFGTSLNAETTGTTNQRFTSYDRSAVSGLDYAVNRTYSSAQGRFTSVDPIGMSATSLTNPQSLNLYAYVQNNPIDYTDPSGLLLAIPSCYTVTAIGGGRVESHTVCTYTFIDIGGGISTNVTPRETIGGGGGGSHHGGSSPPPQTGKCGNNPITNKPGIRNDKPSKEYPANNAQGTGRQGGLGNIRRGNGGLGGFRERTGGQHAGIDIEAPVGTPVYASMDGVVKRVVDQYNLPKNGGKGYGNLIAVNYDNVGLNGIYSHLTKVYVKDGDPVKAGDLIGTTGRTGNANNKNQPPGDDHLHYGRSTGEYEGGSLTGQKFIDPQQSLNNPCP